MARAITPLAPHTITHEKKRGECRIGKEPNALIAGVSLFAMACVTVIASIGLSVGLGSKSKE